jgi:hypothetical protein
MIGGEHFGEALDGDSFLVLLVWCPSPTCLERANDGESVGDFLVSLVRISLE